MARYFISWERAARARGRGIPAPAAWLLAFLMVMAFAAAIPYLVELAWDLSTPLMQLF